MSVCGLGARVSGLGFSTFANFLITEKDHSSAPLCPQGNHLMGQEGRIVRTSSSPPLRVRGSGGRMVAESNFRSVSCQLENHTKGCESWKMPGLCTNYLWIPIAGIHFTLSLAAGLRKFGDRHSGTSLAELECPSVYLFIYILIEVKFCILWLPYTTPISQKRLSFLTVSPTITPVAKLFSFKNERLWFFQLLILLSPTARGTLVQVISDEILTVKV